MRRSLYDKVGGFSVISRIVLSFYDKVLESREVAPYFAAVDMKRLIDHQTKFICSLLGGPASFTDDQIRNVHRSSRITQDAFDEITELFEESLREAALDAADVDVIMKSFESKRSLIVSG